MASLVMGDIVTFWWLAMYSMFTDEDIIYDEVVTWGWSATTGQLVYRVSRVKKFRILYRW